jgi:hypothetical protein
MPIVVLHAAGNIVTGRSPPHHRHPARWPREEMALEARVGDQGCDAEAPPR